LICQLPKKTRTRFTVPHRAILQHLKIVSGGQTGADRAALDWAVLRGVPHGGWCPLGRLAEDGAIHRIYRLVETPTAAYLQRTEWNVRDADATVIFSVAKVLTGGSLATMEFARHQRKPHLHLHPPRTPEEMAARLVEFILHHRIKVLNVAGPAAKKEPEVALLVRGALDALWRHCHGHGLGSRLDLPGASPPFGA